MFLGCVSILNVLILSAIMLSVTNKIFKLSVRNRNFLLSATIKTFLLSVSMLNVVIVCVIKLSVVVPSISHII
jgi:hypothetical protein